MEKAADKEEYISVIYMDLSKTFDTMIHDLLLAKLRANGFSGSALNWLYNYLKSRKQKVVINDKISSSAAHHKVLLTVHFNLIIKDLILFLYTTVLSNYADGNNLYAIGNEKEEIKRAFAENF